MFWTFANSQLIHMASFIHLPDCSMMQGRILSSWDQVLVGYRLCYPNIMWKLETTQIDKIDVGWLTHKYQLSQALSSLQDNLEDY